MVIELTRDEARRIAVGAQLLDADRPIGVVEVAEQLGLIKIDPTAVIAPCEHTVLWSRIGWEYAPGDLLKAVDDDHALFEYDASFRPMSVLPALIPAMRTWPTHASAIAYLEKNAAFAEDVLNVLRSDGPMKSSDIPDTSQHRGADDGWYGNSEVPRMLEYLQAQGKAAVAHREGRTRLWDLAERVYPAVDELDIETAERTLDRVRLTAQGIARQKSPWSRVGMEGEEARVEGSKWKWRVDPDALAMLENDPGGRAAILSPYDRMLFDRPRLKELFEFDFVLEQFKPKAQRKYGYFAHPILVGDRFIGMLDAESDQKKGVLTINAMHELLPWEDEERDMVMAEIDDLARWLGVDVGPIP